MQPGSEPAQSLGRGLGTESAASSPSGLLVPQNPNSTCGQREDRLRSHIERAENAWVSLVLSLCVLHATRGGGATFTGAPGTCSSTQHSRLTNHIRMHQRGPSWDLPLYERSRFTQNQSPCPPAGDRCQRAWGLVGPQCFAVSILAFLFFL